MSRTTSSKVAVWGASPAFFQVTLPPGATDTWGGWKAKSTTWTLVWRAASDGGAGPGWAWPATVMTPVMAWGWMSQWNL